MHRCRIAPRNDADFHIRQININITSIKDWTETGGKYDKEGWRSLQVYNEYRDESINLYLNGKLLSGEISLDGITQIRDYAFGRVNAITSVIIPSTVTSIGSGAFSGCTDLSEIYMDGHDVASMLTDTSSAGGLLNNITTGEKVYIKSGLSVPTYMTENFTKQSDTVVVNDVTYDVYVRK